ncbi:hypothetical protein EYF80_018476 [Liparis tanakae]|uniref:Uncharacterized protein n=1 Tax=Liparis tanakae TaxID=230148 RepID=A0A4Z2I1U9_9TELE|nr:hypothetical protein EYF80_018476 [Liparis tanakae]
MQTSISACLFSSSLATTMARCLPERLQHTAHSQSKVTTASSSGDIWSEISVPVACWHIVSIPDPYLVAVFTLARPEYSVVQGIQ